MQSFHRALILLWNERECLFCFIRIYLTVSHYKKLRSEHDEARRTILSVWPELEEYLVGKSDHAEGNSDYCAMRGTHCILMDFPITALIVDNVAIARMCDTRPSVRKTNEPTPGDWKNMTPIAQSTLSGLRLSLDKYGVIIRTGERDKDFKGPLYAEFIVNSCSISSRS
jgi:hypothetical protein